MANKIDLGNDPVLKIFIHYAVPSVLGMVAMFTAYVVDGIFIGRYIGHHGLAAINLTFPLITLFSGVAMLVGTGGGTYATIKKGEGDQRSADSYYTLTNGILLAFGLFSIVFGVLLLEPIIEFSNIEHETKTQLFQYLYNLFPFFPTFMLAFSFELFVRSDGKPGLAVMCTGSGAVINIVLDYLFVVEFGWGIRGAAWATGASQFVPALALLIYLLGPSDWSFVIPSIDWKEFGKMLYNGSSEFVNETSMGITVLVFNIIIMSQLGSLGVAAFSIAQYTSTIALAFFLGIAQAIYPGISYNLGAGELKRLLQLRNLGIIVNFSFGLLVCLGLLLFRDHVIKLFAKDNAELIRLSSEIVFFYSFSFILMGVNIAASMYFTGLNRPTPSAAIALTRSLIGVLIGLAILPLLLGQNGIWLSVSFAEILTLMLTFYCIKRFLPDTIIPKSQS